MKTTIREYTQKHPFLYMIETARYTISTTDLVKFQILLCKMHNAGWKEITPNQAIMIECDYTVVRK